MAKLIMQHIDCKIYFQPMQGHIRRQIQQQTLLSLQSQQHQQGRLCVFGELPTNHGLIYHIDTKAK
jgi:hypothetical protein